MRLTNASDKWTAAVFTLAVTYIQGALASQCTDCEFTSSEGTHYVIIEDDVTWFEAERRCKVLGGSLGAVKDDQTYSRLVYLTNHHGWPGLWLSGRLAAESDWTWVQDFELVPYQGCYVDNTSFPTLAGPLGGAWDHQGVPAFEITGSDVTADICREECELDGYIYAGVQVEQPGPAGSVPSVVCRCGDAWRYWRYGTAPEQDCMVPCPDDTSQHCGGTDKQRVYLTDSFASGYDGWIEGGAVGAGSCGALSDQVPGWGRRQCSEKYAYICQHDLSEEVCEPESGQHWTYGVCLSLHDQHQTWFQARRQCLLLHGDLLKVDSPELTEALFDEWLSGTGYHWWIGLTNRMWMWDENWDDISLDAWQEDHWAPGSPTYDPLMQRTCLALSGADDQSDGYTNIPCSRKHAYVCQDVALDNVTHALYGGDNQTGSGEGDGSENWDPLTPEDGTSVSPNRTSDPSPNLTSVPSPNLTSDPTTTSTSPRIIDDRTNRSGSRQLQLQIQIGGAVGGVLALGLVVWFGCIVWCHRRKRQQRRGLGSKNSKSSSVKKAPSAQDVASVSWENCEKAVYVVPTSPDGRATYRPTAPPYVGQPARFSDASVAYYSSAGYKEGDNEYIEPQNVTPYYYNMPEEVSLQNEVTSSTNQISGIGLGVMGPGNAPSRAWQ